MRTGNAQHRVPLEVAWQSREDRDPRFDGRVFVAIVTTGIYCKPSCPSPAAKRENVRFFETADDAEAAGFRACLRCRPRDPDSVADLVIRVTKHLEANRERQVTLQELAGRTGVSPFHLQRTFKKATGVTPKDWARNFRLQNFQTALKTAPTVTDAVYEAGFGASSRAYESISAQLGMKPAVWRKSGQGALIRFGIVPTEFGHLLVATTSVGICAVRLGDDAESLEREFRADFARADLSRDEELTLIADQILVLIGSDAPAPQLPVDVRATAFQQRVWRHLQAIPRGETRTYSQVAAQIGSPAATRAVARACATNPVALLVPCHRVVGADGGLTGYRWGIERKRKLLERERQP